METETIQRNYFPHPAMDFFGLRNSAIEYLQKLAGEEWSDFNEHDPGVTILDQLCYAITDLSYRTNYDIRDLLAGQPEFTGKENDTFYTLNEVMPCHPLTINDWRKLFIDKVDGVRNAWIEPLKQDHLHPIGLYRILIEAAPSLKEENYQDCIRNVAKVFHENRNLCEDLESIDILKKRKVKVKASVEVDEKMNSEETLAAVFFNLEKFLSHPMRLYTLPQMLEKGYTIGQIFNSPRLNNGFILDDHLVPRLTQIYYSRLIRVILDVPGVKNVYNFSIEGADEEKKTLFLGDMEIPVLDMQLNNDGAYNIKLKKNHIDVYIENNLVNSYYQAFKLSQPKSYVPGQHQQTLRAFDVKLGRDRKPGEYRSIQYDFPPIYGIGEYGVGDDVSHTYASNEMGGKKKISSRRQGLAQQLKGFLLVFDQVLANYLKQLASIPELFCVRQDISRTYFPATKLDVPRLEQLLKKKDGLEGLKVDKELRAMQQAQLMFSSELGYTEALIDIVSAQDQFFRRRNQFLDHLLARFGLFMPSRMFEDANWYFTSEGELHQFILAVKAAALRNVSLITERRGQAPVLHMEKAISWLELYMQLRLGIIDSTYTFRMGFNELSAPLYKYKTVLAEIPARNSSKSSEIRSPFGQVESAVADGQNFQAYDKLEMLEDHQAFRKIKFYRNLINKKIHVDVEMFRNGYLANNYQFGSVDGSTDKVSVIYRDPEDNKVGDDRSWKIVGVFDSTSEAVSAILGISSFIRFLNIETEGLHLVEHLPLRPKTEKLRFETQMLDASGRGLLQSDKPFSSEEEQEEIIRDFLGAACKHNAYVIKHDEKNKHWMIELVDADKQVIARSCHKFNSEKEARGNAEMMLDRSLELLQNDFDHVDGFRFRTIHPDGEIPLLSFYSFRMTVVMPSWTARFTNRGFQKTMSMLLRNYAPAHTNIGEFWLEPAEMRTFEKLYQQWRKAMAENDPAKESLGVKLGILINQYYFSDFYTDE